MNFVDVRSPVSKQTLESIRTGVSTVQFMNALTDAEYEAVAERIRFLPDMTLRAYGSYDGSITDLDFLRHFPFLRSFQADALYHSLGNIDGVGYLPDDVQFFGLGQTKKRLSLSPLGRFKALRRLYLEGHTKDIEVVSEFTQLSSVTFRSITLPDLSLLAPLPKLRALDLKLGGTTNLALLPELKSIQYLELWMVKGLRTCHPSRNCRVWSTSSCSRFARWRRCRQCQDSSVFNACGSRP